MKIEGSESASGSNSQRPGSADPDPHQNVMDPQYWKVKKSSLDQENLPSSTRRPFPRFAVVSPPPMLGFARFPPFPVLGGVTARM
jgi:hypothetical protein